MKNNRIVKIVLISVLAALVVVVLLKIIGYENPTVIGGGVAGGVAGALGSSFLRKRRDE